MRIPVITLTRFTLGTPPLPPTIPAMSSSATAPGPGTSGLRPHCIWTSIHGVWSRPTPVTSADTCRLPRYAVLRARVANQHHRQAGDARRSAATSFAVFDRSLVEPEVVWPLAIALDRGRQRARRTMAGLCERVVFDRGLLGGADGVRCPSTHRPMWEPRCPTMARRSWRSRLRSGSQRTVLRSSLPIVSRSVRDMLSWFRAG